VSLHIYHIGWVILTCKLAIGIAPRSSPIYNDLLGIDIHLVSFLHKVNLVRWNNVILVIHWVAFNALLVTSHLLMSKYTIMSLALGGGVRRSF
jgi:hypothetical protein